MNTTAAEDIATYFGIKTMARIAAKVLVMRLKINAKIIPPISVILSSPMEYNNVTFKEFHKYLVPDPLNSHFQFLNPT